MVQRQRLTVKRAVSTCRPSTKGNGAKRPYEESVVRTHPDDESLEALVSSVWRRRRDRYSERRTQATQANQRRVEMSYIGG